MLLLVSMDLVTMIHNSVVCFNYVSRSYNKRRVSLRQPIASFLGTPLTLLLLHKLLLLFQRIGLDVTTYRELSARL